MNSHLGISENLEQLPPGLVVASVAKPFIALLSCRSLEMISSSHILEAGRYASCTWNSCICWPPIQPTRERGFWRLGIILSPLRRRLSKGSRQSERASRLRNVVSSDYLTSNTRGSASIAAAFLRTFCSWQKPKASTLALRRKVQQ